MGIGSRQGAAENSILWWLSVFGMALAPVVLACAISGYVQFSLVGPILNGGPEGNALGKVTGNWTAWLVYVAMMGGAMYAARRTRGMVPGILVGVIGVAIYSVIGMLVLRRVVAEMPVLAGFAQVSPGYAVFVALRNSIIPVALGSYAGEKMGDMTDRRQGYAHAQVMVGQGLREEMLDGAPPMPTEGLQASEFGAPLPPWVEDAQAAAGAEVAAAAEPSGGFPAPEWASAPTAAAPAAVAVAAPVAAMSAPVAAAVFVSAEPVIFAGPAVEPQVPAAPRERITTSCPKCRAGNAPSNARCIVCGAPLPALN